MNINIKHTLQTHTTESAGSFYALNDITLEDIMDKEETADEVVVTKTPKRLPRKLNAYKRKVAYKNRLARLANECVGYPIPVIYVDTRYAGFGDNAPKYIDVANPYYKRMYRDNHGNGIYTVSKKIANRKVRRFKGELSKGSQYKRVFDYWYTVC